MLKSLIFVWTTFSNWSNPWTSAKFKCPSSSGKNRPNKRFRKLSWVTWKKKLKIVLKIIALRPFIRFSQTCFVHITKIRILQISKRFCGQMIPKIMWKAKANHKLNFFYIKVFKNLVLILTVLKTHRKPNINFKVPVHQLFPDVQRQNRNFLWKWIWRNLECN